MKDCPCRLCGIATSPVQAQQRREFRHCPCCDLIFVPPRWHLSPADVRTRYLEHHNTIEDSGYVAMLRRPIEMLRRHAVGVRRVLDYGCGPAPVLVELLGQAGYEAVGYDMHFANDTDLSRPFDTVVSVETFEHFAEPRTELSRIVSLLRLGGYLAVMTQFHCGPDTIRDWWYARDKTHVAFYSRRTLDWIAEALGLALQYNDAKCMALLRRHQRTSVV